jgi:hypothetical protein
MDTQERDRVIAEVKPKKKVKVVKIKEEKKTESKSGAADDKQQPPETEEEVEVEVDETEEDEDERYTRENSERIAKELADAHHEVRFFVVIIMCVFMFDKCDHVRAF